MKRLNQSGSHIAALALGVLVIAVIAFAGYRVMHKNTNTDSAIPVSATSSTAPSTINSKADLQETAKSLDTSSNDVNSSVNGDSLNSDLNDLL